VSRARMSENTSPVHISDAVDLPPLLKADCDAKVVHKNAPGAMSAMAFTVMPVRVRLLFISPA